MFSWLKSKFTQKKKDFTNEIEFAIEQFHLTATHEFDDKIEPTEVIWEILHEKFKNEELANNLIILIPIATTRIHLKGSVIKLKDHIYRSGKKVYLNSLPIYGQILEIIIQKIDKFTSDELTNILFMGSEYKLVHYAIENNCNLESLKISAPATG